MRNRHISCTACRHPNPHRNKFCTRCGSAMKRARTTPHPRRTCPQCRIAHAAEVSTCNVCGLPLCQDLHVELQNDYAIITVKAESLDYENHKTLSRAFKALHVQRIVVDMSAVHSIDSIAIGTLVTHTLHWPRYDIEIKFIGLQSQVRRTVDLMKVDNVLDITDGIESCLTQWRAAC